jgi:hypothetical protein
MPDFVSLIKKNPFRPAAWRWLQAGYRLAHPDDSLRPPKDRWIERAIKIQMGLRAGKPREEIMAIDRQARHCLRAFELWSDDSRLTKTVVEARILADETTGEIARKFGIRHGTIEAYEKLFFDVRGKFKHSGYVFCTLLGHEYCDWSTMPSLAVVVKSVAYIYGPWMLDAVLDHVTTSVRPEAAAEVGHVLRGIPFDAVDMKAMLALRMMPINDKTRMGILKAAARVMEIKAKAAEQPDAEGLANASQIVVEEYLRIVEAEPDGFGSVLPKILGVKEPAAAAGA